MATIQNKYYTLLLALFCIGLLFYIFQWVNFLSVNKYIIECFESGPSSEATSHSVDLPLTTQYSCKNFCGPTARCSITGQQCTADIDCPGCQPYSPPLPKTANIPGDNDAGKLTIGMTPQYSSLTSGYGTRERIVTNNLYAKPAEADFGVNTWVDQYEQEKGLFDKRYKPNQLPYMPDYPKRYSLTGQFIEDGPFASNAEIYQC
jgi:hypothetical protein